MSDYGFSSKLNAGDPRLLDYAQQRYERGFDDTETWCLSYVIAKFMVPRLKRFKEIHFCHPVGITMEEWDEIIQKMIDGFEHSINFGDTVDYDPSKTDISFRLLSEWHMDLWW